MSHNDLLDNAPKPIVVLPAKFYDECKIAGLLNDDYQWVRQERIPVASSSTAAPLP